MADDVTTLGLAVDSTQVLTAAQAFEQMVASGDRAAGSATALEKAFALLIEETRGINAGVQSLVSLSQAAQTASDNTAKIAGSVSSAGAAFERVADAGKDVGASLAGIGDSADRIGQSAAGAGTVAAAIVGIGDAGKASAQSIGALGAEVRGVGDSATVAGLARSLDGVASAAARTEGAIAGIGVRGVGAIAALGSIADQSKGVDQLSSSLGAAAASTEKIGAGTASISGVASALESIKASAQSLAPALAKAEASIASVGDAQPFSAVASGLDQISVSGSKAGAATAGIQAAAASAIGQLSDLGPAASRGIDGLTTSLNGVEAAAKDLTQSTAGAAALSTSIGAIGASSIASASSVSALGAATAQLGTQNITTAAAALGEFASASGQAQAAATGVASSAQAAAAALGTAGASAASAAAGVSAASASLPGATTAQAAFLKNLKDIADQAGRTRAELLAEQAAQLGVGSAAQPYIEQIKKAGEATHEFGFNTAQSKRELIVLAHELSQGNFKQFGGSMLVLAEQTGAAGLIFSAAGLAVGAFVAVLAGIGFAAVKGAHEQKALQDALILTGNTAGLTEQSFHSLAQTISTGITGSTVRGTQQTLEGLVASGRFAAQSLTSVATASELFQKATGEGADHVNQAFIKGSDNIVQFATEANRQYHFVTAAQLEYIKNLDDTGQHQTALQVTFDALSGRLKTQSENIGTIQRAWDAAKKAVSGYVDAALNIGKTDTLQTQLANVQASLKTSGRSGASGGLSKDVDTNPRSSTFGTSPYDNAKKLEASLIAQIASKKEIAENDAKSNAAIDAGNAFLAVREQYQTREVERTKALAAARGKARTDIQANLAINPDFDPSEINKQLASVEKQINERFKDHKVDTKGVITEADLVKFDIGKLQAQFKAVEDTYAGAQTIISALHSAGITSDTEFYEQQIELVQGRTAEAINGLKQEQAKAQAFIDKFKGDKTQGEKSGLYATKIAEDESKIQGLRAKSAEQVFSLATSEKARLVAIQTGYLAASQAEQVYFEQLQREDARALAAFNLSSQQAQQFSARNQRSDEFDNRQRQLDDLKAKQQDANRQLTGNSDLTDRQAQDYATQTALLATYKAKSLSEFDDYYAKLRAKQADGRNGAVRALQEYVDTASDSAKLTENLYAHTFSGAEDALTSFLTTGKGVIADLTRISVKQLLLAPAANALKGYLSGNDAQPVAQAAGTLAGTAASSVGATAAVAATTALTEATTIQTIAAQANAIAYQTSAASVAAASVAEAAQTESLVAGSLAVASMATAAVTAAAALEAIAASSAAGAAGTSGGLLSGALDFIGVGHAIGGPVSSGSIYPVGEKGPEILTSAGKQYLLPGAAGTVSPNSAVGGDHFDFSGMVIQVGQGVSMAQVAAAGKVWQQQVKSDIQRSKRTGGAFA